MAKNRIVSFNPHTQTGYTGTETDDVTAKHSFLKNPELKAMTFSYLQFETCQCLLNAALSCKDFLEVALDVLWGEMDSMVPLLRLLPALQLVDDEYFLSGNILQADWDRLQYYSQKVKFLEFTAEDLPRVHPSTYFRIGQLRPSALFPSLRRLQYDLREMPISHIFLHLSPVLDSLELYNIGGVENTIVGPFLATLPSQMLCHILLRDGEMSVDIFKESILHFKQLRSLELLDAIFMMDFTLWEVLGALPSLENLNLVVNDPPSQSTHAPEKSNSRYGGPRYFEALESLRVTGSSFLIRHLLGFIDSPCLKSIEIYPVLNSQVRNEHEPEDLFTPSMAIVVSEWSQSLKNLVISSNSIDTKLYTFPKLLKLLKHLHNMETFCLDWRIKSLDDLKSLVKSWRKLRTLNLNQTLVTLRTLRRIAEYCPELRHLHIRLSTSTIPPFPSNNLCHNLEVLTVGPSSESQTMLDCQIKVTRHLDLIFPYLKSIEVQPDDVFWCGIRDLVHLCQDTRMPVSRVK